MTPRALLRCAAVGLALLAPSRAFAPSHAPLRGRIKARIAPLAAAAGAASRAALGRRAFLDGARVAAAAVALASPPAAVAADADAPAAAAPKRKPLSACLYNVLRVREATEQETRLLSSGQFKDVQRANVKLAVRFILTNYDLAGNVVAASAYLAGDARMQASGAGQSAVQSLFTILEYFDASEVENIKVRPPPR